MYEKILVPVDSSEVAHRALDEAIRLGKVMGSQLRVVHAVNAHFFRFDELEDVVDVKEVEQKLKAAGEAVLAKAAQKAAAAGVAAETGLLNAQGERVAKVMEDEAERWGATLIVIGTHGRTGFNYMIMGSVVEELLRLARVPMLIIHGE